MKTGTSRVKDLIRECEYRLAEGHDEVWTIIRRPWSKGESIRLFLSRGPYGQVVGSDSSGARFVTFDAREVLNFFTQGKSKRHDQAKERRE